MNSRKFSTPTQYRGVPMRSKLEVRWAQFFDLHKINWCYEPGRYTFTDGYQYVPDFLLPDTNQFFEVKGVMTQIDLHKIEQLVLKTKQQVVIGYSNGLFEMCFIRGDRVVQTAEACVIKCLQCNKTQFATVLQCECAYCGDEDAGFEILYKNPQALARRW